MLKLLRRARKRLLLNELLSQGANAVCGALVGAIFLLIAGAQLLDWRWLLLLPGAIAAAGLWRARNQVPPPYAAAQLLDRRLNLADTLSTAFYFNECDSAPPAPAARRLLARADELSQSVDLRKAAPYTIPRAAYPMLALFLIATSLFALRYAANRKLDWNAPMAQLLHWNPFAPGPALAQDLPQRDREIARTPSELGDSAEAGDESRDRAADRAGKNAEDSASGRSRKSESREAGNNSGAERRRQSQPAEEEETRDRAGSEQSAAAQSAESADRGKQGQRAMQAGAQQSQSDSPGLLDRFKDAVQSLFARSEQPGGQESRQNAAQSGQAASPQTAATQQSGAEKQAGSGQGSQRGEADRAQSGSAGQNGEGASKGDTGQKQAGNGIGSQDGDKAIKEAEQLAAMGKISEIFGKRAANLTGQATVEVQSATQQLRTPYEQRSGTHSDAGAEIGRDEVPPALQAYVREYFAQVRKQRKK